MKMGILCHVNTLRRCPDGKVSAHQMGQVEYDECRQPYAVAKCVRLGPYFHRETLDE